MSTSSSATIGAVFLTLLTALPSALADGACCDGASCTEVTEAECVSGTWLGEGTLCGPDCDGDGTVDVCAIAQGLSNDCNADGLPDECMTFASGQVEPYPYVANRTISFGTVTTSAAIAIEVRLVDLPAPFDIYNGYSMWAGAPIEVSEVGSRATPTPGFANFWFARLQCNPFYTNWTPYSDLRIGSVETIPSATYEVRAIPAGCAIDDPTNYSAPYVTHTARWGDVVGRFDVTSQSWMWSDGVIDVASDVVAQLDKFASKPTAPTKARMELEPSFLDWKIGIMDVTNILDAFQGGAYHFAPPYQQAEPCP